MKIAIIGSGYVGLVSGVCLANIGHHVICVDNNPDKIKTLKKGRLPIYEPGLDAVVLDNVAADRPALLVCGEESAAQVKMRAERICRGAGNIDVLAETELDLVIEAVAAALK